MNFRDIKILPIIPDCLINQVKKQEEFENNRIKIISNLKEYSSALKIDLDIEKLKKDAHEYAISSLEPYHYSYLEFLENKWEEIKGYQEPFNAIRLTKEQVEKLLNKH